MRTNRSISEDACRGSRACAGRAARAAAARAVRASAGGARRSTATRADSRNPRAAPETRLVHALATPPLQ